MGIAWTLTAAAATNRTHVRSSRGCMKETDNGRKWCEDGTDGSSRAEACDDCVQRRRVVELEQTRHNAQAHYDARGGISTNNFNSRNPAPL